MVHSIYKKNSFTLIEMLIVIVIIGILAAALVPRLQSVQERARDTKRKVDFSTLYNAFEVYFQDNAMYPQPINASGTVAYGVGGYVVSYDNVTRISGLQNILTTLPRDPRNIKVGTNRYDSPGTYMYAYGNVFNAGTVYYNQKHGYDLITILENRNDPAICGIKDYRSPIVGTRCGGLGNTHRQVYELTPLNLP